MSTDPAYSASGLGKPTRLFSLPPVKAEFGRQDLNLALFCAVLEREKSLLLL